MKRREFLCKTGCSVACFVAAGSSLAFGNMDGQQKKKYKIEIEIFEAREDSWCHKKGEKFRYPEDYMKLCSWLRSSMHDFILCLERGVTLPWKYEGTPYEKVINENGVTTEFVRCPDPTADLVAKITKTNIA
ncbi:MAG: hypothetical protein ACETWK_09405 [Candidatus Aminicenantaceae bacterium]